MAKDEAAVKVAEKKVKDTKRTLLSVNDKLAEAKGRPGSDKLVDVLSKDSGKLIRDIRRFASLQVNAKTILGFVC